MNRIMKRIADDQQLTELQQKGQQIEQTFSNIKTELEQQILPLLQNPIIQSNGGLIGIDPVSLTDQVNSFLGTINSITSM